ncbi:hypothetical protein M3D75_05240 [Microbacterium enclense]|uniref:hypothetical protein n=1 Tax=Microbacterium enclense TaxID=993073 RepID=UPI0021A2A417|nr:hypothetical protein [Microbacterium enclense]MCT2085515.1 hypothetical protein [Microbacterium enclense]
MTAVLVAPAAVLVLDLYAVVLVVLRAKVYRVALYRPMLLNIGLSTLPVVTAIGVRVNSWDVRHPVALLRRLSTHLRQPGTALEAGAFVATHAILVAVLYVPLFWLAWTSFLATAV